MDLDIDVECVDLQISGNIEMRHSDWMSISRRIVLRLSIGISAVGNLAVSSMR